MDHEDNDPGVQCCNGKQKKTGNYEFRYGEANEVAVLKGEEWKKVDMTNLHK